LSLGMFDEDGARVFAARFSLATVRPFGPCRKGRRKVGGYSPKLWSWLIKQHAQLAATWIGKLYLQQFRPVEVAVMFSDPDSTACNSIAFIYFSLHLGVAELMSKETYRINSVAWHEGICLCEWKDAELVYRLEEVSPDAIIDYLNRKAIGSN